MGLCYSCIRCGKCRDWLESQQDLCIRCNSPLDGNKHTCPVCGFVQPPPPGVIDQRVQKDDFRQERF